VNNFADNLISQIKDKKSIICIGLDPRLPSKEEKNSIPQFLIDETKDNNEAIFEFNKRIIDATCEFTPIYKPNIAFYEQYYALSALKDTINYIKKNDSLSILDAKRGDIGSTSKAYARDLFENYKADAITINSYFGTDGVEPFLSYKNKGFFTQVKNSNPSSAEFQDLFSVRLEDIKDDQISVRIEDLKEKNVILERNFVQMARLVKEWGRKLIGSNGYSSFGAVVGATFPEQMKSIRNILDKCFLLIPGYGAQGATAQDIINGINEDGLGAIVNSSRGIIFAYQTKPYSVKYPANDFEKAASQAASDMSNELNKALK
jgi:orotidine-5'-phosphate decarboxylase